MEFSFQAPLLHRESALGWSSIVMIPQEFYPDIKAQDHLRVEVLFNRQEKAHVSIKSKDDSFYLILNNTQRKKLKVKEGDLVQVHLKEETSEYGMPMPEELALMLAEDERANEFFHLQTPGNRRSLIYLVSKVKSADAKIRKALAIVEHLLEYQGKLDYKGLNSKMKEVNERFR